MIKYTSELTGSLIFRQNGLIASQINPGMGSLNVTGSLNITGSKLLLNGKDVGSSITSLEAGQGADQIKFGDITLWSASLNTWTGSIESGLYALSAFSASTNTRLDNLEEATTDYIVTLPENIVSSSRQIENLGFITASITELPGGLISRSAQIIEQGFITGSSFDQITDKPTLISSSNQLGNFNDFTGSTETRLTALEEFSPIFKATGSKYSANVDLQVTGSFSLNIGSSSNDFSIYSQDRELFNINSQGVLKLIVQETEPDAIKGGMYFGIDGNLYLGLE